MILRHYKKLVLPDPRFTEETTSSQSNETPTNIISEIDIAKFHDEYKAKYSRFLSNLDTFFQWTICSKCLIYYSSVN